ncbi:hypothetical protein BCR32DRAFT_325259 [Anaeromyces robustus]|jgi:hypothetical protein|uniref:CBM10 domain-containing protein n=1 Tax=Anaeromyces robustus TaxID=1754192 RepID=A0A1Y1XJJ2_9FUNG|nr:hypothetical protein BCR32DRAFT_325259 [Anaeromyces robustus]|eukprot:ORX85873.1 hypothetical protein BCR32DRAFT_325259 [Anaeromyces robustus]
MDFIKRNLFVFLFSLYCIVFVNASTPGFEIKVGKSWSGDGTTYTQAEGEIINASKLKINNWYIEVPFDGSDQRFLGSWGCVVEEKDDKLILTGEVTNQVIKVLTNTTFGFIVASTNTKFDVETAVLHTQTKAVPNHTKADGSNDSEDMNIGLPYEDNRYFLESMDEAEEKAAASALSIAEVKAIIFKELNEHWDVVSKYLGTDDMLRVFALFLGWASRESTLNAGVETAQEDGFGVNSAHAYGPFQTAITAFYGCDPTFDQEDDVPEMYWYTLTHKNFYDPYISTHMGIRKLIHFVKEAESFDQTGIEIIRCALKGFNSGHANPMQESEKGTGYSDEIGSLAGWYYKTRHFDDNVYTWTGDERVDRSDPWGWWEKAERYDNIKVVVRVRNPEDGTTATYTTGSYPTATSNPTTTTLSPIEPTSSSSCWAQGLGYPCCEGCEASFTDGDGDWAIENGNWCGIDPKKCNGNGGEEEETCFSIDMGYPCCSTCTVVYTDSDGGWGVENGEWCGVPSSCF